MNVQERIGLLVDRCEDFVSLHDTSRSNDFAARRPLKGDFSLVPNQSEYDLYGMIDATFTLFIMNQLTERTTKASRGIWAERLLACQDEDGWFTKRNLRGHSREHATAYAIAALRLLEVQPDEHYLTQLQPLHGIFPILTDRTAFLKWIRHLQFRPTPGDVLAKNLGWHYIWRGSHIGGGVAAAVGMTSDLMSEWWPGLVDTGKWFDEYIDWLNQNVNAKTGYWQRAFWNTVYRKPTLIDMGGAVHFFWIYDQLGVPFQSPEAVIQSTISLQRQSGLYRNHPFCIDLDGNFCVIRSFLQLDVPLQQQHATVVHRSVEQNFSAVLDALSEKPLIEIYDDSHGLPGALAALVEAAKLPNFAYATAVDTWRNPFDTVWWL